MFWKTKRNRRSVKTSPKHVKRRIMATERLEMRRLFAADPIHVGVVYIETDYLESDQDVGGDSKGDRFILSFTGGAAGTELTELRINTDKFGDGISIGDPLFDTIDGGRGKDQAQPFKVVKVQSADGQDIDVVASVEDGGQELVLKLSGFRSGDRIEFTIDVDEVLRVTDDLDLFNSRLDVITSGQEFQDSILEATFNAPHYETSHADSIFLNDYGDPASSHQLNLPADEGPGTDSLPNRTAAAIGVTTQVPKPISISGQVWLDNNLNQTRDTEEMPLANVEIALWQFDSSVNRYVDTGHRAATNANGEYLFAKTLGLAPGKYRIVETQPEGLYSVAAIPGSVDGVQSGLVETVDRISDISIPLGDTDAIRYDFAEANAAAISGFVYRDDNLNGQRETTETGIAGVRVRLVPINTIAPQSAITVTTSADGSYRFDGLAPGSYEVIEVDQPDYLNDGADSAGTIDGRVVGRADNPGDAIRDVHLVGADSGIEYNFGETPFGSISGYVYLLAPGQDCNGIREANGNQPLAGVKVVLQDDLGVTISETTTTAEGSYQFNDVPIGNYRIVEYTPAGLLDGKSHVGRIDGVLAGTSIDGGLIREITMTAAGMGVEYNFCEIAPAAISGFVYHDQSNDGMKGTGEQAIPGTTVSLVDESGTVVASTKTDANGHYEFKDIVPGNYRLVESQPANYFDGKDTPGTIRGSENGRIGADGDSLIDIALKQGDVGVNYNFGELVGASLSGRVHVDMDNDCTYDAGEPTLEGIEVRLFNKDGDEVARTTTDAEGMYHFTNIEPGEYSVVEGTVDGYFEGTSKAGSAGGQADPPNRIGKINLASAEVAVDYDFCEKPPAEIRGVVFADQDQDCTFDSGEMGIANVVVELYDDSGNLVASTRTDANGKYQFTFLPAGHYTVRELQPVGWLQGGQIAGSHGGDTSVQDTISAIPIGFGDRLTDYNFCEVEPGSIAGVVYVDTDADCVRDPDEAPLEGVRIDLKDASGAIIAQTQTDANGHYSFGNLMPGEYEIAEHQPDGYFQGGQMVGSGGGRVLGDDRLGTTLLAGAHFTDYDFCEIPPGSIAGTVYVDHDADNQYDSEEPPIAGVTIELRNPSGQTIATTKTDSQGNYRFEGLAPGDYQIFEQQPTGYYQGGQSVGTGGGRIVENDLLAMTLKPGRHETEYNFGELPPGSISGSVHVDKDADCMIDPDEPPIAGVTIELRDDSGRLISQTQTDSNGRYRFANLPPGRYHIIELQPVGYFQGAQHIGSGGGEVIEDDHLALSLSAGNDVVDYNFCELEPSSISGSVWSETDLDFQYNSGDVVISGVTIELMDENGNVLATTKTDSLGNYEFKNLAPGIYSVREAQPSGLFHGSQLPGSAGGSVGGDDLLVGIRLVGGTTAIDYDFPEIPPATISGYVFQDGDAISASKPPAAEDLRDYKDGILKPNDVRIGNVTLELRNVLGQPFESERALPGIYADAVIRITTDANGYYEFTGLRPGTYHVYQIQPEDYIDGLDTPGSTGGLAVNKADALSEDGRIMIQTLALSEATHPRDDAILNITLVAGGISQDNNFSEILVREVQIPRLPEPVQEEVRVFAPIETFARPELLVSYAEIDPLRAPLLADDEWAVSWHLSVINGGFPRGNQLGAEQVHSVVRGVNATTMKENWSEGEHRIGRWIIVNSDGKLMEIADVMTLGEEDAIALTGDFDGNGSDEAAIFVNGNWFIDINGNGRWDQGDLWIKLGTELDRPVVGDWDGDGKDDIGIFGRRWQRDAQRIKRDPGLPDPENTRRRQLSAEELARHHEDRGEDRQRLLRRGSQGALRADAVDHVFQYGEQVDTPIVGDWNGDGIDQIGIVRGSLWILDSDGDGRITPKDEQTSFGRSTDEAIVGDFNGDGIDEIAVVRGDVWIIDSDGDRKLTANDRRIIVPRTGSDSQPIVGDFDGDGKDDPGYYDEDAA
ncbi:Serine-aspartate repeat-containing protein D precursor [Novipirellula aureliae]|uniref:Serine-aspartate repeat-containing protein D n=2 Tax=Novipirellula aureliae TaxID=2527966 RepID=A0A5C6DNM6_9BACT|nr:SdrD B-like domain-containing protein [Novipirellula aureliae]TWU36556.1 Serine-aspartate repeat-containing protein D precursor [Novipirellula aureliae]